MPNWLRNAAKTLRGFSLSAASFAWRRTLADTRFVAVTGSVGKTTATRCLAAALATQYRVNCTKRANNSRIGLARTILATRRSDDFCVIEVGTQRPGSLRKARIQVRPDVVVFLSVAHTHADGFAGLEDIAREKAALLSGLDRGFGVLNGEDPNVMSVAGQCRAKIVTFGRRPDFDYWATEITSVWPERLRFRLHSHTGTALVRTNLVGAHWVDAVLGALATAISCGVPMEDAAASVAHVQPYLARMQPAALACGATMLRDEFNGSVATAAAALRVLRDADQRRVLVHGDLWDSNLSDAARYEMFGKEAALAADVAVFVGPASAGAAQAAVRAGLPPENVHGFANLRQAADFLKSELRSGDLVLLRGKLEEHLSRLYHEQGRTVRCWRDSCGKLILCDRCPEL